MRRCKSTAVRLTPSSGNVYLPATTNVTLLGDFLSTSSSDLVIAGNVAMSPNASVGATRTFNLNINTSTTGEVAINGVISGAAGSNIIKTGTQVLVLNGTNTYQGTTTINAGTIAVGTNVAPNVNGALGNSDTPIILGGGTLQSAGLINISRDIDTTAASTIIGNQAATTILSGGITNTNNPDVLAVRGRPVGRAGRHQRRRHACHRPKCKSASRHRHGAPLLQFKRLQPEHVLRWGHPRRSPPRDRRKQRLQWHGRRPNYPQRSPWNRRVDIRQRGTTAPAAKPFLRMAVTV